MTYVYNVKIRCSGILFKINVFKEQLIIVKFMLLVKQILVKLVLMAITYKTTFVTTSNKLLTVNNTVIVIKINVNSAQIFTYL